jgi:hypothetical protein
MELQVLVGSILLLVTVCGVFFLYDSNKQVERINKKHPPGALSDTIRWNYASEKRQLWSEDNPVFDDSDLEWQILLQTELGAYLLWKKSHPNHVDDGEYLETLSNLIVS